MQNKNDDISNTITVLALILAILGLIIAAVSPVLGPLAGLVLASFLGGGATCVWADRRFQRHDKVVAPLESDQRASPGSDATSVEINQRHELERIDVAADDVWVHAQKRPPRELRERLPPDVRAELSERDFVGSLTAPSRAPFSSLAPTASITRPFPADRAFGSCCPD